MEVVNRTILDLDPVVIGIEKIALKYLEYPKGVYYVEGSRQPMTNKHFIKHFIKKQKASEVPLHPVYGMEMLRDCYYLYLRNQIATGSIDNGEGLLTNNSLIPNGDIIYPMCTANTTIESIVRSYIPNILLEDLVAIIKDLKSGYKWIEEVSKRNPFSIYEINITGKHVVIEEGVDIRAYRFEEAMVYNEILRESTHE